MLLSVFFFFNDTATTEIYTLSLHDALPIWHRDRIGFRRGQGNRRHRARLRLVARHRHRDPAVARDDAEDPPEPVLCVPLDRKSTRLNSSHANISYAVFCLKKKKH